MSGFSVGWLALREPVDAAARCVSLARVARDALQRSPACIDVIDLGAGTGANLRYVAPLIETAQRWLLVDNDPVLLEAAVDRVQLRRPTAHCEVQTLTLDLATQLSRLPLPAGSLLTASALLDLVSAAWLRELIQRGAAAGALMWFALTYDGRMACHPADPEDAEVRELVNRHHLTDKGFGAAVGPGAARLTQELLAAHGYHVHCAASDWHIAPEQLALQHALVEGWCQAAAEIAPDRAAMLQGWLARRRAHIAAARSELRVGHVDIVGHP
jgi:SAM-dependent methyltransferase